MFRTARVAVVGVGALGTRVCECLGEHGVGRLQAIDPDRVEASNLRTTPAFSECHTHRWKTDVMREMFTKRWTATQFQSVPQEVAGIGFSQFDGLDIIFSCVDSDAARLEIAYIAKALGLAICDAGIPATADGRARVTLFTQLLHHACYACLLAPSYRSRLLQRSYGSIRGCSQFPGRVEDASIPMSELCTAVAEEQVSVGLAFVNGKRPSRSLTFTRNAQSKNWERIDHERGASCPFHQPQLPRLRIEQEDETIAAFLKRTGAQSVILDWPICVEARCGNCFAVHEPFRRMAAFWRQGKCPDCQGTNLSPLVVVDEVDLRSPWSGVPLADMGIPNDHILMVTQGVEP